MALVRESISEFWITIEGLQFWWLVFINQTYRCLNTVKIMILSRYRFRYCLKNSIFFVKKQLSIHL
jgi:hypothetical protein